MNMFISKLLILGLYSLKLIAGPNVEFFFGVFPKEDKEYLYFWSGDIVTFRSVDGIVLKFDRVGAWLDGKQLCQFDKEKKEFAKVYHFNKKCADRYHLSSVNSYIGFAINYVSDGRFIYANKTFELSKKTIKRIKLDRKHNKLYVYRIKSTWNNKYKRIKDVDVSLKKYLDNLKKCFVEEDFDCFNKSEKIDKSLRFSKIAYPLYSSFKFYKQKYIYNGYSTAKKYNEYFENKYGHCDKELLVKNVDVDEGKIKVRLDAQKLYFMEFLKCYREDVKQLFSSKSYMYMKGNSQIIVLGDANANMVIDIDKSGYSLNNISMKSIVNHDDFLKGEDPFSYNFMNSELMEYIF